MEVNSTESKIPRYMKYLIPSLLFSIVLNIPKFFELELITSFTDQYNITHSLVEVGVTSIRTNPIYMTYYLLWTRLKNINVKFLIKFCFFRVTVTVFIPFCFLSILNLQIYRKLKSPCLERNKPRDDMTVVLTTIGKVYNPLFMI